MPNNTSISGSSDQLECQPADLWMRIVCVIVGFVCIVIGGAGNLTTIVSIVKVRSLRRFTNINIFLLAGCDLVLTTYVCGFMVDKFWFGCWRYSFTYCQIYTNVNGVVYHMSLMLLALVSYDRFLMVKHGAGYAARESKTTVCVRTSGCLFVVVLAVVPALNLNFVTGVTINEKPGVCLPEVVQIAPYYISATLAGTLGPIAVMTFCYFSVLRYRRRVSASASMSSAQITARNRATLLVQLTFVILIATGALYLLTTVVISAFAAGYWVRLDAVWWTNLYNLAFPVAWLNSAFNPILYAYVMPDFRRAARVVWGRLFMLLRKSMGLKVAQFELQTTGTNMTMRQVIVR